MIPVLKILASLMITTAVATGQPAENHALRIFPLGDPPPYIQEVRDGVRYEVPAAEGTIPPRNIVVTAAGADATRDFPLRLRLGSPSSSLGFPAPPDFRVNASSPNGEPWLTIPLADAPASLAFVWRAAGKTWASPRVLVIPDQAAEGGFRFVNLAPVPMALTWGREKIRIDPATSFVRRLPEGTDRLPVTLEYPAADGTLRLCFSTEAEAVPRTRQYFIIHAADGEKPRMPVKVRSFSENMLDEPQTNAAER